MFTFTTQLFAQIFGHYAHFGACGKECYFDFFIECIVESYAPDDFDVVAHLLHEGVDFFHFAHQDWFGFGAIEVEKDFLRFVDIVVVEQRRVECILDGGCYTIFAFAIAIVHDSNTAIAHDGADIGKVDIDVTFDSDDFDYTAGCVGKHVVGIGKCVGEGEIGIASAEALVVDNEHGIDVFAHHGYALEGLTDFAFTFESKWDGDDADCKDFEFASDFGNDRCCSCTCATTHACGDEYHAGAIVEHIANFVARSFGCLKSTCRSTTCTKAIAKEEFVGNRRATKCLLVGVAKHESDVVDALFVHVVDGIATASADTYYFDD